MRPFDQASSRLLSSLTLDGLRGFEATARLLSFTAAAEELCLTQSAVSKQIKAMEEALGCTLFVRGARPLALTEQGRQFQTSVRDLLVRLLQAADHIAPTERPSVSITVPPSFASLWLAPRLAKYQQLAPDVDVRLDASEDQLSLDRTGFDLAVRLSTTQAAQADWQPLVCENLLLVAAPSVARKLRHARDLQDLPLLSFDHAIGRHIGMSWAHWYAHLGLSMPAHQAVYRFSQYEHLLKAAVDGAGVAIGRMPLAQAMLGQGQLQHVLPEASMKGLTYYLVCAASPHKPHVHTLAQWLMAQCAAEVPTQGSGERPN